MGGYGLTDYAQNPVEQLAERFKKANKKFIRSNNKGITIEEVNLRERARNLKTTYIAVSDGKYKWVISPEEARSRIRRTQGGGLYKNDYVTATSMIIDPKKRNR